MTLVLELVKFLANLIVLLCWYYLVAIAAGKYSLSPTVKRIDQNAFDFRCSLHEKLFN